MLPLSVSIISLSIGRSFDDEDQPRSATKAPHEMLGDTHTGTVTVGKRAELILVDRNPLEDLSTLHRIRGVLTSGKWWNSEDLKDLMERTNGSIEGDCSSM